MCSTGNLRMSSDWGLPCRTAVLFGMSASTAVLYCLIAVAGLKFLLPLAMAAGLVFGAHWALMPSCTSELFGARHFAANQSIIHLATAVGAFTLSTELAGNLYQHQGVTQGDPKGTCKGKRLFQVILKAASCEHKPYTCVGLKLPIQAPTKSVHYASFLEAARLFTNLY